MITNSDNHCKAHPEMEHDSYCPKCNSIMCFMCVLAHKKANPEHQIEPLASIGVSIASDIEQMNPTNLAVDLIQAEISGSEKNLKQQLFELNNVTESVKVMASKCIDEWAKPQIDKIIKDLEEYDSIKNQMKSVMEFSQNRDKMFASITKLYSAKKFMEMINMKDTIKEIRENLEKSIGAKEKVKVMQEKNKKLKITFGKEIMGKLNNELKKTLDPLLLFLYNDICAKCYKELKSASEVHKCSICKKNDIVFCSICIEKCSACNCECCKQCLKPCEKCNKNMVCLKCQKEPCSNCSNIPKDSLLSNGNFGQLLNLCGKLIKIKSLLFKASRDGYNGAAFHKNCDKKGKTLVVVKSEYDKIFGMYADSEWDSQGDWVKNLNNFAFSLSKNQIYKAIESTGHQYNGHGCGALCGRWYFCIGTNIDNWNTNRNNYDNSISSDGFTASNSYISGSNDKYFSVKEVEVFHVEI